MGRVWGLIVRPAVLMLAVWIPVAGCSTACPAIGWVNSVTVELAGDLSRVDSVQLCADGACSELRPEPGTAAPRIVVTTPLDASAPFTPEAQPTMAPLYASRIDADTWRFTVVNMSSPDHVTAKAVSHRRGLCREGRRSGLEASGRLSRMRRARGSIARRAHGTERLSVGTLAMQRVPAFDWKYTRTDLNDYMHRLDKHGPALAARPPAN